MPSCRQPLRSSCFAVKPDRCGAMQPAHAIADAAIPDAGHAACAVPQDRADGGIGRCRTLRLLHRQHALQTRQRHQAASVNNLQYGAALRFSWQP
jgi:hypothetical protein